MTLNPLQLLKVLGSGIRPDGAAAQSPNAPIENAGFDRLLQAARSGQFKNAQPLELRPELKGTLSGDQLQRLAPAADAAEAAGATRLLAIIDDKRVVIDILTRTIESVSDHEDGHILTGFDAVIRLAPESPEDDEAETNPDDPQTSGALTLTRQPASHVTLNALARFRSGPLADIFAAAQQQTPRTDG